MQILLILALVVSIAVAENAPQQPVSDSGLRLLLSLAAMLVAPLFAFATSSIVVSSLRRNDTCSTQVRKRFARLRNVHALLWLGLAMVILWQLGWAQMVRFNWSLGGVLLVDDLLVLFPLLSSLVLSWAAFYDADRKIDFSSASSLSHGPKYASRFQYLALHARHHLALLLVPVLGVFAVQDLVRWAEPQISDAVQAWILLFPVVALALFFPVALRWIWQTAPLECGALKDRLAEQSRRSGLGTTKFFIWQTNRMMVNAAVAGMVRPWRYVFFTDALLDRFTDSEIEAVLAHEIGHVRRHHVLDRLLAFLLPVLLWYVLCQTFPAIPQALQSGLHYLGANASWQSALLAPLVLVFYAATVFAAHAKLLEYEADLFAVRTLCEGGQEYAVSCRQLVSVLEKLSRVGGIRRETRTWLHPSIAERISLLLHAAEVPTIATRFELRMYFRRTAMLLAFVVLAVYLAFGSA